MVGVPSWGTGVTVQPGQGGQSARGSGQRPGVPMAIVGVMALVALGRRSTICRRPGRRMRDLGSLVVGLAKVTAWTTWNFAACNLIRLGGIGDWWSPAPT